MPEEKKSLGTTLKLSRQLMSLTLRQVEGSIQISNAYLSQLENDKIKRPSANVLYKLSNLYKVNLDILLYAAGIIQDEPAKNSILNNSMSGNKLTTDEEERLLDYLAYLRYKKRK